MTIHSFEILSVPVTDQQRAKHFYRDVLGFALVREEPMGPGTRWIQLAPQGQSTTIALVTWFEQMKPGGGTVDAGVFDIVAGQLSTVNSSKEVTRGFCSDCGSSLTYQHALRSGEIDFTVASLENPSMYPPVAHIWVSDKLAWVQINDSLPQYQTVVC